MFVSEERPIRVQKNCLKRLKLDFQINAPESDTVCNSEFKHFIHSSVHPLIRSSFNLLACGTAMIKFCIQLAHKNTLLLQRLTHA